MAKKILRVGFDLDGVLLYNPARLARMPVATFKHLFFPARERKFFIPRSFWAEKIWSLAHLSSLFIASGFDDLETLLKKDGIEAYVITARFNFLQNNANSWFKKLNRNNVFKQLYVNTHNQQPHFYKEKLTNQLKLDIFVDDNYDIVRYLSKKTKADIFWIYNLLDWPINYPHKFSSLKGVVNKITSITKYGKE